MIYKNWSQKVNGKYVGHYVCARQGLHINYITKMSESMLNDYAKVYFLQFKRFMNSLTKENATALLPGLLKKSNDENDMNFHITSAPLTLAKEKDVFCAYSRSDTSILSQIKPGVMNWKSMLDAFARTSFFKNLTPSDWYDDLNPKAYISPLWYSMFKELTKVYPEHLESQKQFVEKMAKSTVMANAKINDAESSYNLLYLLEYTNNTDIANKVLNYLQNDTNNYNKDIFKVVEILETRVFTKYPETKKIFKDFNQKLKNLDESVIFDTDEELFHVVLSFAPIQKRFKDVKNKNTNVNNIMDLKDRLFAYFLKYTEGGKDAWANAISDFSILDRDSFDCARIIVYGEVNRNMGMNAKDIKKVLEEELDYILTPKVFFKHDEQRHAIQTQELMMLFDREKNNAVSNVNSKVLKF